MKKLVKFCSGITLAGMVLLSSGCSCSLSKDKLNERTQAVYDSTVDYASNYETVYKIVQKQENSEGKVAVSQTIIKTTRDVEKNQFTFDVDTKMGFEGEELQTYDYLTGTASIYSQGNVVFVKNLNDTISATSYTSPVEAYKATADLVKENKLLLDYYSFGVGAHDKYKETVFHGCSTKGNVVEVPDIHAPSVDSKQDREETFSCKGKKKLFGKDATYTLHFRVSVFEERDVTIVTNKDNHITEVNESSVRYEANEKAINQSITFTISK